MLELNNEQSSQTTNQVVVNELDQELNIFDFSHYPLPPKTRSTLRIFYNNINGLEINKAVEIKLNNKTIKRRHEIIKEVESFTKVEAFLKQMYDWEVDISTLAEPGIEWRDAIPKKIVQDIGKKYDRAGNWTVATSDCYSGSFVKPGGALIYSTGKVVGKITDRGTDPWKYGRWSYVTYSGKSGKSLMIICGYRVGHRTGNAGASTAWYQQKVLLAKDSRVVEPEDAFVADMEEWVTKKKTPQMEILLVLDANKQWTDNAKIKNMASNLQLLNLNTDGGYQLPGSHPCITNQNRNTTIDYCLCTQKVLESTKYVTLTPYDLSTLGDHRGLLVDIDVHSILSNLDKKMMSGSGRKLTTTNPSAVTKYLELVDNGFQKQNIYDRVQKLSYQWGTKRKTKWDTMKTYEILDGEIFHICKKAERGCTKTYSGRYQWSPRLVNAIKTLAYWKARLKYNTVNKLIQKLGMESGVSYDHQSDNDIRKNILQSRESLREIQSKDIQHRRDHLEAIANTYAVENNVSKANAISELISHESIRSTFSLLKEKLKQNNTGQLNKVWVAYDEDGHYVKDSKNKIEVEDPEDIHNMILKRNRKHLGQAKKTPFATGQWAKELNWDGTGDMGSDILSGSILNTEIFSSTAQLYFES